MSSKVVLLLLVTWLFELGTRLLKKLDLLSISLWKEVILSRSSMIFLSAQRLYSVTKSPRTKGSCINDNFISLEKIWFGYLAFTIFLYSAILSLSYSFVISYLCFRVNFLKEHMYKRINPKL